MHNILVTGADGQLGREMRTLGAASRHRYFFTDVADLDITDANAVRRFVENERIDAIVNCAAYTNVDKAEEEAETADRINHEAVRNLAEAAKACGATLFHISTDYVFDGSGDRPWVETDAPAPLSVYGATKLEGERLIQQSGCRHLILRTSWVYAARGGNFAKTMLRLAAERDGARVASCAGDGTIRVWEAATGACAWQLEGSLGGYDAVAFAPDGLSPLGGYPGNDEQGRINEIFHTADAEGTAENGQHHPEAGADVNRYPEQGEMNHAREGKGRFPFCQARRMCMHRFGVGTVQGIVLKGLHEAVSHHPVLCRSGRTGV